MLPTIVLAGSAMLSRGPVMAVEDPAATKPQPLSLYVFLFLGAALIILLVSMSTHLRRARTNLREPRTDPASGAPSGGPGTGEPGPLAPPPAR